MNSEELALAWQVFTTGSPRDALKPEYRDAAEAAITAGTAHWAPVDGIWRLRWNFPQGSPPGPATP